MPFHGKVLVPQAANSGSPTGFTTMKSKLNAGEYMYSFYINPTANAQSILDLEFVALSCRVQGYEAFPLPWDAGVEIVNSHLEIEGGCFPSSCTGTATVRIHLKDWAGLEPKPVVISATGPWETFNELRRRGWEVTQ